MTPEFLLSPDILLWLVLIGFAAGFLDSVVGGGGLIAAPAMLNLFPHWSILNVVGTNRTSSVFGTSLAAWNYFRTVRPESHVLWPGCVGALTFSLIGVQLAQRIDSERLKLAVLFMIIGLAIYSSFKTNLGQDDQRRFTGVAESWAAFLVGSTCGFYNGLIGPGTGTLLVFGFVSVLGLDFLRSSAVSKAVNVAGDLSSLSILLLGGYVVWGAAIPLVLANLFGSYCGSRLAILKGSRFIRRFFLVVIFALIARLLWQVVTQ